jgi:hypothetical protein
LRRRQGGAGGGNAGVIRAYRNLFLPLATTGKRKRRRKKMEG